MSTLSDVQALYGGVRDTWAKSQAHVVAHVVLAGVVFVVCGATIPYVSVPRLDPKQISDNEWFRLAKDTGVVYVSFVIPFVVLAVYAALLRTGGQLAVATLLVAVPPSSQNRYRIDTSAGLEPLALALGKGDFHLSDLDAKSAALVLKFQSGRNELWNQFQESVSRLTKNSQVYLGDFLLFLLFWTLLFRLAPKTSWVQANEARFWPVVFVLIALIVFAWFRVSRAISVLPSMLRMYVAAMIRIDPDTSPLLEVSVERRESVRRKLEELLDTERRRAESRPSLLRYLRYKLGLHRQTTADGDASLVQGWPFPSQYEDGFRFSWDEEGQTRYDGQWLSCYGAYLYYRAHRRLSVLAHSVWRLLHYIVTGVP